MDLLGLITGLPAEAAQIPWDGPEVRIIEHQAHAPGHAALLIEERGVLVAGDMLSDVLIPMLDLQAADPIEDYLAALRLLEGVADDVDVVVPGHGSVGGAEQLRARIDQDRAYVQALRDGGVPSDPRIGPSAKPGWEWVSDVHAWQLQRLAATKRARRGARRASGERRSQRIRVPAGRWLTDIMCIIGAHRAGSVGVVPAGDVHGVADTSRHPPTGTPVRLQDRRARTRRRRAALRTPPFRLRLRRAQPSIAPT